MAIVRPARPVFVPHSRPMSKVEMARSALQVFDQVVAASGLRVREGQRLMAEQVALTFSEADLGKPPEDEDGPIEALEPQRSIAVIQAGTGVGKSLAYSVPAIAMALARGWPACPARSGATDPSRRRTDRAPWPAGGAPRQ